MQSQERRVVRLGFIGAGEVNFGSEAVTVPWNHARVLDLLGRNEGWQGLEPVGIKVVGVADVNAARADAVAERWRAKSPSVFGEMKGYGSVEAMLDEAQPEAVIIGLPPFAHGLPHKFDFELECARRGIHLFVEKPISSHPPEEVAQVRDELKRLAEERNVIVSVGYMFRYATPVLKMRQLLAEHAAEHPQGPAVRAILLKYNTAYPAIAKAMWWDSRLSGGPIIEQCTHFADLARFVGGEVKLDTLTAIAISAPSDDHQGGPGYLSNLPNDVVTGKSVEEGLPAEFRIPRLTTAHWRFESGAVGSLTHGAMLHGDTYECEMEVWGDGIRLRLEDPYNKARLLVSRDKGSKNRQAEECFTFPEGDDNFYEKEIATWLHAIHTGDATGIQSSYEDAFKSFELTWAIRLSSETNRC
jgi:predicted dehydrogenase